MSSVTIYGLCAISFMMAMYALEGRGRVFVVGFAAGCLLSSAYGFLSGAWPFGVVEIVWSGVALLRLRSPQVRRPGAPPTHGPTRGPTHGPAHGPNHGPPPGPSEAPPRP